MSAVLLAVFNEYDAADRVRTRLVTDGFPTDRVELTSAAEQGRAGMHPAPAARDKYLQYFRTLLRRPEQRAFVDALADPLGAKKITAWLPDEPLLYDKLTPVEYLDFVAGLWGVEPKTARKRTEDLLRWLDLWEERAQRCETFSRGMKQKASLAGALIHDPRLLILDEPLTGLDAGAARQVKDLLQERARGGATGLTLDLSLALRRAVSRQSRTS